VPGIRENGGQYTHAAMWTVRAFAELGRRDRAAAYLAMISPVSHGGSSERLATYRVEPYVVVADIYSVDPHVGRGGWTWYTGSAGWLYRAGLEAILGFRLHANVLAIDPCVPAAWPSFDIVYRRRTPQGTATRYDIAVENPDGVNRGVVRVELDGEPLPAGAAGIPLADDGRPHRVRVVLG